MIRNKAKNSDSFVCQAWAVIRTLSVLIAVFLAACASRPDESADIRTLTPKEAVDPIVGPTTPEDLPKAGTDNKHRILALSAGGADGAFGAGILAGWSASGKRPEFDVVTGVSTGSLLAVLAFLGPEYDELIRELYTTQTNDTIFRSRGLGGLLGDSLYDNGPLQTQIETHVTAGLLKKIAAEHKKGRRLYIATTNLDAGELVIWDMGKIAQGGRANPLQHFQKILRASAAVPGYFRPVYIKPRRGVQLRQAHVDGGVKEPVLYAPFMARTDAGDKELYLVINGTTRRFNASKPVEPKLASIAQKTISELIRELQHDTIFHHFVSAKSDNVNFRLVSIPDEIPIAEEALDFDPVRMNKLYKSGYEKGLEGPETWRRRPPSFSQQRMDAALELSQ